VHVYYHRKQLFDSCRPSIGLVFKIAGLLLANDKRKLEDPLSRTFTDVLRNSSYDDAMALLSKLVEKFFVPFLSDHASYDCCIALFVKSNKCFLRDEHKLHWAEVIEALNHVLLYYGANNANVLNGPHFEQLATTFVYDSWKSAGKMEALRVR